MLPATLGTDLPVGRVPVGVAPLSVVPAADEIRALASLAVVMAKSSVGVSKALSGKPNDVLAVFLTARGLGVDIMTALRTFHVIEGQVSLSPKIRLAMAQEIGRDRGWKIWPDTENGKTKAIWHCQRPEFPTLTFSSEFAWEDAQESELVSWDCKPGAHTPDCRKAWPWKDGKPTRPNGLCKENWRKYPARMLSWRACGYLLDDRFPEVGQGLYSPDELGAITDEDGNPIIDVASVEVPPGMTRSDGRVSGAAPAPEAPGVAKASEELKDKIRERIAALPDGGRVALKEWWGKPKGDGSDRAPLTVMTVADSIAVQAFLAGIEKRAKAGEWGGTPAPVVARVECPDCRGQGGHVDADSVSAERCETCKGAGMVPAAPEKPLEAPESDETCLAPVVTPEVAPPDVQPDEADVVAGRLAADFKAIVAAMDNETVVETLTGLGQATTGRPLALRGRLEAALIAEHMADKWRAELEAQDDEAGS